MWQGPTCGGYDNRRLTGDGTASSNGHMRAVRPEHSAIFGDLKRVRREALEHALAARDLSGRRAELIHDLMRLGYAQADIARELGVTRQAVQKMASMR